MKIKIIIVVLAVAAIGLGIGLLTIKQQAEKQHESDTSSILDFSNQVVTADQHIETLRQDNLALTNSLNASVQQAGQLSNSLAAAKATVITLEETRTKLTAQVSSLDSHVNELNANITGLFIFPKDDQYVLRQKKSVMKIAQSTGCGQEQRSLPPVRTAKTNGAKS